MIASNGVSFFLLWSCSHRCIRLLGVSGFRPRFHPGRYRVEAADETVEEILAESSAINGCFVCVFHFGQQLDFRLATTLANEGPMSSAGICAAVKTSKVPITVEAKTDITCECA